MVYLIYNGDSSEAIRHACDDYVRCRGRHNRCRGLRHFWRFCGLKLLTAGVTDFGLILKIYN